MDDGGLKPLGTWVDIHDQEVPSDVIEALRERTSSTSDERGNASIRESVIGMDMVAAATKKLVIAILGRADLVVAEGREARHLQRA
jgi:hypothetical protein